MQTITLALKHWHGKITDGLLNREAVKKSTVSTLPAPRKLPLFGLPLPLEFPLPSMVGGGGIFSETIHFIHTVIHDSKLLSKMFTV